jgi:hypothetical protein
MAAEEKKPAGAPESTAPRQARGKAEAWGHVAAGVALAAMILLMVNYLAFRHFDRLDWTSQGLFTVSDRTVEVLRELDRTVDVYLFMSEGEPKYQDMKELVSAYRAKSDKVRVHYVDPDRQTAQYRVLAQRFGIGTLTGADGVAASDVAAVVAAGERNWKITRDDLLSFNFDEGGGSSVDVEAERALTGAILEATTGRPTQVCVTAGHGEWDLSGGGRRGLAGVRDLLDRDNVELRAIQTLGGRAVPSECDAVYVIGPDHAFAADEVASLEGYLGRGGNVMLALDPVLEGERIRPSGFESMLREHGITLDASVVLELDSQRLLSANPIEAFVVTDYGEHPTTSRLAPMAVPTVMLVARSVRPADGSNATTLIRTSPQGYAESDLSQLAADSELSPGPDDVRGPVSLAVATQVARAEGAEAGAREGEDEPGGRLVVVGDSDWLTGEFLGQPQFANMDLLGGFTGWLTHRRALISIAPRTSDVAAVVMTEGDLDGVFVRVILLMPLAMILLGFSVWWSRRA